MKPRHKKTGSSSLWRNRNYLLLEEGQIVSFIGNQQQCIALPLLVLALSGSPLQAGIVLNQPHLSNKQRLRAKIFRKKENWEDYSSGYLINGDRPGGHILSISLFTHIVTRNANR
jgi:hypothetical protein